ncbi:hypothetical protein EJD97_025666, partial [Solanum chilense]
PYTSWRYVMKAVLSANPSITRDYVLSLWYESNYCGDKDYFAFWSPGDLNWTHIQLRGSSYVASMIYHKGQFYYLNYAGEVWNFYPNIETNLLLLVELDDDIFDEFEFVKFYLVEVSGALLVVIRFFDINEDKVDLSNGIGISIETNKFKVCEIDIIKGELKEIKNMEDSTIFVGRNEAICIDSSKCTGVKPNHIYFTDDCFEFPRKEEGGVGRDMGCYNLENGKTESIYPELSTSLICPPTWISPSFIL